VLREHIGSVAQHLSQDAAIDDPLAPLRAALSTLQSQRPASPTADAPTPSRRTARAPRRRALFTDLLSPSQPKPEH
jgi:hypothetical protein